MNESHFHGLKAEEVHDSSETPCIIEAPSRTKGADWSLVLTARGIPHTFRHNGHGSYVIEPASSFCSSAKAEIATYEEENRNWPHAHTAPPAFKNADQCIFTMLLLTAAMGFALSPEFAAQRAAGAAWAVKIVNGEWWRAATALTIHADPVHLLGNMLTGGFIMVHACGYMGTGLAWFLAVTSGIAGNIANAFMQPPWHVSVGSSTAIFGITGAVTACRAIQQRNSGIRGYLIPLGAGLALLGFTGTSGKNTDLAAHACGFASGIFFGVLAGLIVQHRGAPERTLNRLLAITALFLPAISWYLALH